MKKRGNVIIGDHVWIGVNCYIGPGINIGENSVVGANSVVTHNVKPYTIVGGVPARMIKEKAISI
jgi:acetyltransferase-like isoleucine patch superfamily enzyme